MSQHDQPAGPAGGSPIPPPPQGWTSPPARNSSNTLKWILGVFFALVILGGGGCAAVVILIANSTTNYVDVANEYLDALRSGEAAEADRLWCDGPTPDGQAAVIDQTSAQNLTSVAVVNAVGDVTGTVATGSGPVEVIIEVRTVDDAACVSGLEFGPNDFLE